MIVLKEYMERENITKPPETDEPRTETYYQPIVKDVDPEDNNVLPSGTYTYDNAETNSNIKGSLDWQCYVINFGTIASDSQPVVYVFRILLYDV